MRRFLCSIAIAVWAWVLVLGLCNDKLHHIPTFKERWQPAIDHPLKPMSLVQAFCAGLQACV